MTAVISNNQTIAKANVSLVAQGIFWKVFSCACFAAMNALVRLLSAGSTVKSNIPPLPIYTIMLMQNAIGLIIIAPIAAKAFNNGWFKSQFKALHAIRAITAALGIGCWYLSLSYMPLALAVALSFSGPILTIVGCKIFLSEHFNWQRVTAVALSLIGGFLILRPDKGLNNFNLIGLSALLPIASATIFAGSKIITRKLTSNNEHPFVITFYLLLGTCLCCTVASFYYGFSEINYTHIKWLIMLASIGVLGHYSFNKAYSFAEVTFLMPFGLSKFILSGLAGYLAFGERPNGVTMWSGIIIIFLSSFVLHIKNNFSSSTSTKK